MNVNRNKTFLVLSFTVFAVVMTRNALQLKSPTGDAAAVYFPVLAKLMDGQGPASFTPLMNGFFRTPALDLMAYSIHFIFRTNVLTTVRIFLILSGLGVMAVFYLLISKMLDRRTALLSLWFLFSIPNFHWLSTQFLTDVPALLMMLLALYLLLYAKIQRVWVGLAALFAALLSIYIRPPVYLVLLAGMFPIGMILRSPKLPWKKIGAYALIFYSCLVVLNHFVTPQKEKLATLEAGAWNRSLTSIELEKGSLNNAIRRRPLQFFKELAMVCLFQIHQKVVKDSFGFGIFLVGILLGLMIFVKKGWSNRASYTLLGVFCLNLPLVGVVNYEQRYTILLYFFYAVLLSLLLIRIVEVLAKKTKISNPRIQNIAVLGLFIIPIWMSSKTVAEFHKIQVHENQAKLPAEQLFHFMLAQSRDLPLDILYKDLSDQYFPDMKAAQRPLRYFTNYRYFEYTDLNYVNSVSPFKDLLIEQDNAFPHPQEPEDMLLMGGPPSWRAETPMIDPARIPDPYRVILAQTTDDFAQTIALRVPYPRAAIPIKIRSGRDDMTGKLQDKDSSSFLTVAEGGLELTLETGLPANEIMLFPKSNGKFPADLSISVLDPDAKPPLLNAETSGFQQGYNNPISIPIRPFSGRHLFLSLKPSESGPIELSEVALFYNDYENRQVFLETKGAITNGSFIEERDGFPSGWAVNFVERWKSPLIVADGSTPPRHWLKFENSGRDALEAYQQVGLEEGFYVLTFIAKTIKKPSSYCQIEFMEKGTENWIVSSYERIRKPQKSLYFKTFRLEKPSSVRFRFHQYVPEYKFGKTRGITLVSDIRLFKLQPVP